MVKNNLNIKSIPKKKLTEKQMKILEKYSDKLDSLITLEYKNIVRNARLWRKYGYQGGAHGLRNDKEAKSKEVKNAQQFLNDINAVFRFTTGKKLVADGIYGRRTFERTKEFQRKINELLRSYNRGVRVEVSSVEKRLISFIVRSFKKRKIDLYKDKPGRYSWKSNDGKRKYELRMLKTEKGIRKGELVVRNASGSILKRINFKIDAKGNVSYDKNAVMLYEIMVDGYFGVETRRAVTLVAKRMLKDTVRPQTIRRPVKSSITMTLGVSFAPYLAELAGYIHSELRSHARGNEYEGNKDLIDEIVNIYSNMTYKDEIKLRKNRQKIKVDGKEYNATWQDMLRARIIDDVPYEKFLKEWMKMLKKSGVKLSKEPVQKYMVLKEISAGGKGGGVFAVDFENSDLKALYLNTSKHIKKVLKPSPWRKELLDQLKNDYENACRIVSELSEKNARDKSKFINSLEKEQNIYFILHNMYDLCGYMPSVNNIMETDYYYVRSIEKKAFKENLLKFIKYEWKDEKKREAMKDMFGGVFTSPSDPTEVWEDLLDEYYDDKGYINLRKMREDDENIWAMFISFAYGYSKIREYNRRKFIAEMKKKEKSKSGNKIVAKR